MSLVHDEPMENHSTKGHREILGLHRPGRRRTGGSGNTARNTDNVNGNRNGNANVNGNGTRGHATDTGSEGQRRYSPGQYPRRRPYYLRRRRRQAWRDEQR